MQPYDVMVLVERLKGRGFEVAEKGVAAVVEEVFGWTEDSVRASATPFDDVALVVLPKLRDIVLKAVDKIDGRTEL